MLSHFWRHLFFISQRRKLNYNISGVLWQQNHLPHFAQKHRLLWFSMLSSCLYHSSLSFTTAEFSPHWWKSAETLLCQLMSVIAHIKSIRHEGVQEGKYPFGHWPEAQPLLSTLGHRTFIVWANFPLSVFILSLSHEQ